MSQHTQKYWARGYSRAIPFAITSSHCRGLKLLIPTSLKDCCGCGQNIHTHNSIYMRSFVVKGIEPEIASIDRKLMPKRAPGTAASIEM